MYRVCVTGGSGGVGSHIIRLLSRDRDVKTIISVDAKPLALKYLFPNENFSNGSRIQPIRADVCDKAAMLDVTRDCDVIFHSAACIDVRAFPDIYQMDRVNKGGTETIVQSCLRNNIPRLIHTSSIDVMIGAEDAIIGDSMNYARKPIIYHYGLSKRLGEEVALRADGEKMRNGEPLRVIVLRPHAIYGEGSGFLMEATAQTARKLLGYYPKLGVDGLLPATYAGNVAWCHIQAWKTSLTNQAPCGKAYIIEDDTPKQSFNQIVRPFMNHQGYKTTPFPVPKTLLMNSLKLSQGLFSYLRVFKDVNMRFNEGAIDYIHRRLEIAEEKDHKRELNYEPLYDPATALSRSLGVYDRWNSLWD